MNGFHAQPGWSAFSSPPCSRVGSKMNHQTCSLWRLWSLSPLANPWTFLIFNMPEIPNTHADHCPLYEFSVSITPKPEQKTSLIGRRRSTFRFHLMWPRHDEGLSWLKLMALLSILLCWTNSQFNNKTLNKKQHQQPTLQLWWTESNLILSSCFVMIKLNLR